MSSGSQPEEIESGRVALDASAVLAWLMNEEGGEIVEASLPGIISAVNLAEVVYTAVRKGLSHDAVRVALQELPLEVVPFDTDQAHLAAVIHTQTRSLGLSLGDCACLALAASRKVIALTADHKWSEAGLGLSVRQVR